jgi:hypothetical protein
MMKNEKTKEKEDEITCDKCLFARPTSNTTQSVSWSEIEINEEAVKKNITA